MQLTSTSFLDGEPMPVAHSRDGEGSLPVLVLTDVPEGVQSFAVTVHDPDVPRDRRPDGNFDHWVVWNLPADTHEIASPTDHQGVVGLNTLGAHEWVPASPPPGSGAHRYIFTAYALDAELDLPAASTRAELEVAMAHHVLASAQMMGTYERP